MGRRKRKVVRAPKKKLPNVFLCPKCGINAVRVITKNPHQALVKCGNCGFDLQVPIGTRDHPVDLYCKFTDLFYAEA